MIQSALGNNVSQANSSAINLYLNYTIAANYPNHISGCHNKLCSLRVTVNLKQRQKEFYATKILAANRHSMTFYTKSSALLIQLTRSGIQNGIYTIIKSAYFTCLAERESQVLENLCRSIFGRCLHSSALGIFMRCRLCMCFVTSVKYKRYIRMFLRVERKKYLKFTALKSNLKRKIFENKFLYLFCLAEC